MTPYVKRYANLHFGSIRDNPQTVTQEPHGVLFSCILRESKHFSIMFVDPRYEDEAIAALMEEALSESEQEKFDVEAYLAGDQDYA